MKSSMTCQKCCVCWIYLDQWPSSCYVIMTLICHKQWKIRVEILPHYNDWVESRPMFGNKRKKWRSCKASTYHLKINGLKYCIIFVIRYRWPFALSRFDSKIIRFFVRVISLTMGKMIPVLIARIMERRTDLNIIFSWFVDIWILPNEKQKISHCQNNSKIKHQYRRKRTNRYP
jgi:uncharacterized membrane protein YbaN (DUF454 family)